MRFCKANRTGATHTESTNSLGHGSLDAFSQSILFGKAGRLLSTASSLKRFILGLWLDRKSAPLVLLCRADTVKLTRTTTTIGGGELDLDHFVLPVVDGWSPIDTVLFLGTGGVLMVPIDNKLAGINALLRLRLPFHITPSGPNHFNTMLSLTADENGGGNRARTLAGVDEE